MQLTLNIPNFTWMEEEEEGLGAEEEKSDLQVETAV